MMFFKLWKHDLDYGLLRKMIFYVLLGFGQAFLFCRGFSSWAAAMSSIPDVGELTETFGNHLLYLFQGIDEYIPSPDEPFDFPSMWLLVFLCGNLLTLTYPLRDLEGIGQQILVRSGRREYWWLAKCGWEIVSSFGYLLMLALGVLSYCLVFRIPIKAEISQRLGAGSVAAAGGGMAVAAGDSAAAPDLPESAAASGRTCIRADLGICRERSAASALGLLDEVVSAGKLRHVPPEYLGADRSGHGHGERSRSSDRGKPLCDRSWGYSLPSERHSEEGVMSAE